MYNFISICLGSTFQKVTNFMQKNNIGPLLVKYERARIEIETEIDVPPKVIRRTMDTKMNLATSVITP